SSNLAIVDAETNFDPASKSTSVRLCIANETSNSVTGSLLVEGENAPTQPFIVNVPGFKKVNFSFPPLPPPPLTFVLSGPPGTNLSPADDKWYISDPKLKPCVIIDAPCDSVLFHFKSVLPLVEFLTYSEPFKSSGVCGFIAKGALPAEARNLPTCSFLEGDGTVAPGEIMPWNGEHPILRFTDWDSIPTDCLKPGLFLGFPLVESVRGIIVSEELTSGKYKEIPHIWVGLDPDHPSLKGNIFLPVFLYNILEYLLRDDFPRLWYPVGHPSLSRLFKNQTPSLAGFHKIPGRVSSQIAINLQAPTEANISPGIPRTPTTTQSSLSNTRKQSSSFWKTILGTGLIFILFEWYLYIRRN
ncbi:hypothetical protein HYY75_01195, partial [bacterium]|nr:hypothetical protein [bacterium]